MFVVDHCKMPLVYVLFLYRSHVKFSPLCNASILINYFLKVILSISVFMDGLFFSIMNSPLKNEVGAIYTKTTDDVTRKHRGELIDTFNLCDCINIFLAEVLSSF